MSQDEYYANTAARLDTIIGGDTSHFLRLQRVRNEWQELGLDGIMKDGAIVMTPLNIYVEEQYGIKMIMDGNNLSLEYIVVDEKKYTMFLLKFNR